MLAWFCGAVVGALAVNTGSFVGPLSNLAGGIDLTTLGSGLIAVLVYGFAILVMPDRVDAPPGPSTINASPAIVP